MKNKIRGYLGLAARGRYLLFGEEQWEKAKKGMICFLANDAREETKQNVQKQAGNIGISLFTCFSKKELGSIVAKSEIAVLIVTNYSLARQMQKILDTKGA